MNKLWLWIQFVVEGESRFYARNVQKYKMWEAKNKYGTRR